jgi:DNA repair exonuclease SbcCD ATPase subunit
MLSVGLLVVALGVGATLVARKRQRRGLLREAERRAAEADLKVHQDRRAKIEATLARSGLAQADAVAIEAAARRHEETLDRIRMHATWVEHRVVLQSRLKMLEGQLAAALAAVGAADWASYVEACRERQRLEVESRRRVDLERLLSTSRREHTAHLEALRSWDERLGAIERASILLGCGPTSLPREEPISRTSLAPLVARIAELLARHDARGLRHKLSEERASLLGTEDKASLVERLGLLRSRVVGRVSQREERGVSSLELDRQITALQREVAQREAALHERLRGMPSVAELEERLDLALREHARLRRLDRLVAMTMEQLMLARDTIHRDIAPRLSAGLSAVIPRLTGGRWERARIAVDDLAVSVMRDHEWRPAHDLSCGTAEQVYLALRVILAATLAKATEPPPLILDDVLVHADGARREELLDWLAELAERHQIILTTHDHSLVGWAQTLGGRVHELTCAT